MWAQNSESHVCRVSLSSHGRLGNAHLIGENLLFRLAREGISIAPGPHAHGSDLFSELCPLSCALLVSDMNGSSVEADVVYCFQQLSFLEPALPYKQPLYGRKSKRLGLRACSGLEFKRKMETLRASRRWRQKHFDPNQTNTCEADGTQTSPVRLGPSLRY